MNGVVELVRTLGAARLAAMGAVAFGLIGFFIFLIVRVSQPQMGVLFTDLAFEDSAEIVQKLDAANVPYEMRQGGSVLLVPKDRVLRLRMELAQEGLPSGGTVGYEIFDKGSTLGATSFVQNINRLRAIEGELARTIRTLDRVQAARVHLVLPERQLFARSAPEPSASIVLKVRGSLDAGQIKAVQHLAASAVEGLKPGRVSIVDENGRLLASGSEDGESTGAIDERQLGLEQRLRKDIEDILSSIVGPGRARVRVTAEMDYNRITQTSDVFDPEGRVIRSTQSREEISSAPSASAQTVTVGNELPSAGATSGPGSGQESDQTSEETVNYEISRTTKTEVVEPGRIKRLSVAVLVDGVYTQDASGKTVYTPRPQQQLDQIAALVRTAMGFDAQRGDQLHVANLQFVAADGGALGSDQDRSLFDLSRQEYFQLAELAVLVVISLLVLLFVVRPLVRQIIAPDTAGAKLADLTGSMPATAPAGAEALQPGQPMAALPAPNNKAVEALKLARVEGDLQASAVREVGDIVDQNPDEAVSIIRQWIQQT